MSRPTDYAYCSNCERKFELNLSSSDFSDRLCPGCRENHPAVIAERGYTNMTLSGKEEHKAEHDAYMESCTPSPAERYRECACGTKIEVSEWECWRCKRDRENEQESRSEEERRRQEELYRDSH